MAYNQIGDIIMIGNTASLIESLAPKTYLISLNEKLGFHLKIVDPLKLPEKVYGDNPEIVEKIMRLFEDEQGRTSGVMLHGAKGTGKTLTAVGACIEANKRGYPVLLLQSQFYGSAFNDFMANVGDSCVVFIDEFEKIFNEQDAINSTLMLLDGAVKTHKLFILTSNQKLNQDGNGLEFLANRPSRIFYSIYYGTMEDAIIKEYLDDNLVHKSFESDIFALKRSFKLFTIDILKAIVSEVNRYGDTGKSLQDMLTHLNVVTDRGLADYRYEVSIHLMGRSFDPKKFMDGAEHWRVGGTSLENVLVGSDWGDSGFSWDLKVPTSLTGLFTEAAEKSPHIRNFGDNYDLVDGKRVAVGSHFDIKMHNNHLVNGSLVAEQDQETRAITISDSAGVVEVVFKPILESQKKVSDFII